MTPRGGIARASTPFASSARRRTCDILVFVCTAPTLERGYFLFRYLASHTVPRAPPPSFNSLDASRPSQLLSLAYEKAWLAGAKATGPDHWFYQAVLIGGVPEEDPLLGILG